VDWWEAVTPDLRPLLARVPDIVVDQPDTNGAYAGLRFNLLQPPFNEPAARRALLKAVRQSDFMTAVAGDDPTLWSLLMVGVQPSLSESHSRTRLSIKSRALMEQDFTM
jgi:hypothetical protein